MDANVKVDVDVGGKTRDSLPANRVSPSRTIYKVNVSSIERIRAG